MTQILKTALSKFVILVLVLVMVDTSTYAQSNKIDNVRVEYKKVGSSNLNLVNVIPKISLILLQDSTNFKIHFKIMQHPNNTTAIYSISYLLNSAPLPSANSSIFLFKNQNGAIQLSNGQAIPLKLYKYSFQIEDINGKLSEPVEIIN